MMKRRLIFEGRDDKHVIKCLLYNHGLEDSFDYKDKEGVDRLLGTLADELEATDADRFGIIVDADLDLSSRWASLQRILVNAKYRDVPNAPDPAGTVVTGPDGRAAGVWLMPDNRLTGILEDFVAALIAQGDVLWPRAQTNVDAIPTMDRRFKPTVLSKAKIHTWLAWQEEPGTRMGETFKKKYLDPGHASAMGFVNWIRRLMT